MRDREEKSMGALNMHFAVEGEFICQLARSWFWDQDKPYAKCEELLLSVLESNTVSLTERKQIAREILEGKKILKGVNTLTLEEDGENIRAIEEKIEEYRKREMIRKIKEDMELYPEKYVDPYSCPKDIKRYAPVTNLYHQDQKLLTSAYGDLSPETNLKVWVYATEYIMLDISRLDEDFWNDNFSGYLKRGLYLLRHPELVFNLIGEPVNEDNQEFLYEQLYKYFEEKLLRKEMDKETAEEIIFRNKKYLAAMRGQSIFANQDRKELTVDELKKNVEPDDFLSEYGLIDKNGNYYSCGFAGHHIKAYYLIQKKLTYYQEKYPDYKEEMYDFDKALDILYEEGWVIIRNPLAGGQVFFDYRGDRRPTKHQIDTAFDHMIHFNERTLPGIEKYMDK